MSWQDLHDLRRAARGRKITTLFETPNRAKEFSVRGCGMLFDYSKTNIDTKTRWKLLELADKCNLPARREAMFTGKKINETEGRAVLHTALRNLDCSVTVDGADIMPEVRATHDRMEHFARRIRAGEITDIVNIGIGGSDLGPAMAYQALAPYADGPRCHFVSNVDGAHITDVLAGLDAKTTLIIVASKTFTTIETMTNAKTARAWMDKSVASPGGQFVALSSNLEKTAEFGIPDDQVFGFGDWIGGRYSVWGPIGLSLMLAIGPDNFRDFLSGGAAMDAHFRENADAQNMPVMLALVGIWHNHICGFQTRAVLPYDQRLARLPAYLQQLEMESNGKRVDMEGHDLTRDSGAIIFGEPGTNGQHAFYQLLHQGTHRVPCEFMVAREGHEPHLEHQHRLLVANCLAQSEALLRGRSLDEARAKVAAKYSGPELERQARHRVFTGNRPSTTLVYPKLTPRMLGAIIALYEHRVFVEGALLGINSFDQWGVELGKELALEIEPLLQGASAEGKDGSTQQLIQFLTSSD